MTPPPIQNPTATDAAPKPAQQRLSQLQGAVGQWIGRQPLVAIGAGVVIGAAIGWLVKQKK